MKKKLELKSLSIRKKIFYILGLSQILLVVILSTTFYLMLNKIRNEPQNRRAWEQSETFRKKLLDSKETLSMLVREIINNPRYMNILDIGFSNRIVLKNNQELFTRIMKRYNLDILEIGDANGHVWFRFHRPKDWGDDKSSQKIIQEALAKNIVATLETGHSGMGLRVTGPIKEKGTIMIGRVVDNQFINLIRGSQNYQIGVFENKSLLASSDKIVERFVKQKNAFESNYRIRWEDRDYYIVTFPYNSGGLSTHNLTFLVMIDETELQASTYNLWILFILIAVLIFAGIFLISFLFSRDIINAIRSLSYSMRNIDEKHKDLLDLEREDELGQMANDFLNMVDEINEKSGNLEKQRDVFYRFVPAPFIRILGESDITKIHLGEQTQKTMSILFSDIRSFTTLSEKYSSKEIFDFINDYLSRMSPEIDKNNGFIDKYIGDAIMALFPGDSFDAIWAAVGMQKAVDLLNVDLLKSGRPFIQTGTGIHTGELILGTVGDQNRMDTTVISDVVNVASRLETLTKSLRCKIIASETSIRSIEKDSPLYNRFLGNVVVKGKNKAIPIYEIFAGDSAGVIEKKNSSREKFEKGIHAYMKQKFEESTELFQEIAHKDSDDMTVQFFLKSSKNHVNKKSTKKSIANFQVTNDSNGSAVASEDS